MSGTDLALVVAAAAGTALWLLIVAAVRVYRQPREPADLEPTLELGSEPPALAGFLAGNFSVAREAVPATLLDLCARGLAEIERVDVDTYVCRLTDASADELARYELRVLEHLRDRARGGIVPTRALTTGPGEASKRWWRAFVNEVVDDAQERGLSRDLWPRRLALLVGAIALVPALLLGLAFGNEAFFVYLLAPGFLLARVLYGRRQRDTPSGLEAAARWCAVQAKLAENPVFAEQPPIAVAIWERLLAYGAALGVAPAAIRPVPMGAEEDTRAWSTYGGRWHEVEVRYRHWPHWGAHPAVAFVARLAIALGGAFALWLLGPLLADAIDDADGVVALVLTAILAVPAFVAVVGGYAALQAGLDLFSRREVTGEVVRLRTKERKGETHEHYVAVDDGTSRTVRAWLVRPDIYAGLQQGQVVTAVVTPRLRYVHSIT